MNDATLASLPPCLVELDVRKCTALTPAASFAHLVALQLLAVADATIGDASLVSLPPLLESLDASNCRNLTPAAVLPCLPVLWFVDVSATRIGDAMVASLPAGLRVLRLEECFRVTRRVTLDHLLALRVLRAAGSPLPPAVVAACRARGCAAAADGRLRGHTEKVCSLALLADGRLASSDEAGKVKLWDMTVADRARDSLQGCDGEARALAVLPDGRLLVGTAKDPSNSSEKAQGCIEVWEVDDDCDDEVPVRRATIDCGCRVLTLAVLLDGRLAAGCDDAVKVVDVDAGTVVAELRWAEVAAMAVLPDGGLVTGTWEGFVGVWDVGAQDVVAMMVGHTKEITALAALADGRLASAAQDFTVRLWDVGAATCVAVLELDTSATVLAALPDGRLVSGYSDGTIWLWDTRPAAAAASSRAEGDVSAVVIQKQSPWAWRRQPVKALLPLPGGRLATCTPAHRTSSLDLWQLPPPAATLEL